MTRHPFELEFAAAWPPEAWSEVTVVAAVSGGCDSVALLRALAALRRPGAGRLIAAHFDHRLRPESAGDRALVVALAGQLGLPCETGEGDVAALADLRGDGLEEAARAARLRFLSSVAMRTGARFVVTAHTADDQAETILQRIVRGTGLAGLAGIRRARELAPGIALVRPLLTFRRSQLQAYLADLGQPYRTDETNADTRFTRNRLRQELLPELADRYNPQVVDALVRLGTLAGEAQLVIDRQVAGLVDRAVTFATDDRVAIDVAALAGESGYLVRELLIAVWRRCDWPLQAMGFREWDDLAAMIHGAEAERAGARRLFPGGIAAQRQERLLTLERRATAPAPAPRRP